MKGKLVSLCLVLWLALNMSLSVAAADFNADRLGSISVTLLAPDIKTPIEGKEPLCWKVGVNITKSNGTSAGDLEIYINAVTGELIGVIKEKN